MIIAKHIENLMTRHLQPEEVESFMQLYAELPFGVRQLCAEQLVAEPTLAPLFFTLLQNEEAYANKFIDESTFLANESALTLNFCPA